jgi:AraC-like DNA-binding protein
MNVWVNDHLSQFQANDMVLINSKDIHSTKCLEPTIVQLLQIPYALLQASIPELEDIRFDLDAVSNPLKKREVTDQLHTLLIKLGEVYVARETGYALQFSSLIYELLFLLVQNCRVDVSLTTKQKNSITHKRLITIMDYVKLHYKEPISLQDAASLIALNPEYFCRFFKKNMGITFLDYVHEIRLSHVFEDLMTKDTSITQLLEIHGFSNYKLFLTMFHEKYGCTPLQMRKKRPHFENYFKFNQDLIH